MIDLTFGLYKKTDFTETQVNNVVGILHNSEFIWSGVYVANQKIQKDLGYPQLYQYFLEGKKPANYEDRLRGLISDVNSRLSRRQLSLIGFIIAFDDDSRERAARLSIQFNPLSTPGWSCLSGTTQLSYFPSSKEYRIEKIIELIKKLYEYIHPPIGFFDQENLLPSVKLEPNGPQFDSLAAVNLFGPELVNRFKRERILSSPAQKIEPFPDGGLFIKVGYPFGPNTEEVPAVERHLGLPGRGKPRWS